MFDSALRLELKFEFECEFEFGFELEFEFMLQFGVACALDVQEAQFWPPRGAVLVSERLILDHFRGLGKRHLWEFG